MSGEAAAAEQRMRDYEVFEHLGSGATSDVYRVVNKTNNRTYVLKKMSLANMSDEEQLRAKQEIIVMDNVDHPNIVKFRESFMDPADNSVDIIMEYCEFGTLEDLIERQRYEGRPFPTDVLLEWMAELLCGLSHIHSNRILHRDLKTSNIFVTSKNHLKLGDFGVCTILSNPNAKAESMIGTPLYFAPEVCNSDPHDERSDVWSLGVVFYEMCTLRRPFEAGNLFTLIQLILESDIEPFGNGVDGSLEGLVRQMLDRDPSRRPTAQELIDVHLEVPVSHPSHPSQKPSRGRLLQQFSGPELQYTKKWPPPEGSVTVPPKSGKARATDEWIHTGSALDVFVELQRTLHRIPTAAKAKDGAAFTPSPQSAPGATLKVSSAVAKPKPEKSAKKSTGAKGTAGTTTASSSLPRTKAIEHAGAQKEDAVLGTSLLSFTMRELQLDVQRRRTSMFGEEKSLNSDDIPLVIEVQGESFSEATAAKATVSFLADIAAVIDRHTANGGQIALEALDGAACLLSEYKHLKYAR
ncbi:serine/threonine-protein kinase Nek [Leishmania donovani]|uniref:non-specific serine/threonine protein kinase n=1 Tax=Leishmania donovani TaxID=5661 RepID=A0A3S5H7M0_LEIDO|nr:serine/threonine-protein kinase Nek3, putative [Leishmania donovani]AYU80773.1 serine/threonine-protein kinase Nek, putative [Leishmania donovani]CAJ1990760.1 serine/threonine-protein kinase Nek [Leishmania donovani]CBZ36003.1 serine/threonine-protein kinase Nek3, putative [Leishmania donovani]VDZ46611.1 serine/threonine-protein_kinase_Nek_putative/GeneDB:LmjF.29.2670 [Leishmania donovani]